MIGNTISYLLRPGEAGSGRPGCCLQRPGHRLRRSVALKFPPDDFADNQQLRERFQREARTASALNHPNICTIYDIGEADGRPFIVMEFSTGPH